MTALLRFMATLGPIGFFPIAPATAGSAVVTLIAWFVPVLPLPVKHRIYFGEARNFVGDPEDDDEQLAPLVKQVQGTIQSMLHVGLKERKHVFW